MFKLALVLFCLVLSNTTFAEPGVSKDPDYIAGIKAYQAGDYESARLSFQKAWESSPDNPHILYNWGLSEFHVERLGMAIGAWRRALALEPGFDRAEDALDFALIELRNRSPLNKTSDWESFREKLLTPVSFNQYFAITWVLLLASGFILSRYFGKRRQALKFEEPLPPFPSLGVLVFIFFLISSSLLTLKGFDFLTSPRATVVAESVEVRSGPSRENSSLFELIEGIEVIMKRQTKDWVQVTYPGGLTGWVPASTLFHTSGHWEW